MTVATLKDVLRPAIAGHYAVAGLVVLGWEDARAFVEAAEETGLPVILQAGPGARRYTPVPILGKMFRLLAEQARVPSCVTLIMPAPSKNAAKASTAASVL